MILERVITGLIAVGSIFYFIGLIRVMVCEKNIKKLYKEKKQKIETEHGRAVATAGINLAVEHIEAQYKPQIEELERKRRFILDKLPFLRK